MIVWLCTWEETLETLSVYDIFTGQLSVICRTVQVQVSSDQHHSNHPCDNVIMVDVICDILIFILFSSILIQSCSWIIIDIVAMKVPGDVMVEVEICSWYFIFHTHLYWMCTLLRFTVRKLVFGKYWKQQEKKQSQKLKVMLLISTYKCYLLSHFSSNIDGDVPVIKSITQIYYNHIGSTYEGWRRHHNQW